MTKNQIDYMKLEEDRRHNQAVERETKRTNEANEAIKQTSNAINERHYQYSDAEAARHNLAYEMETNRHNVASETISWFDVGSQDKLRTSQSVLNYSTAELNDFNARKITAEADKAVADTALAWAKVVTEEDYTRPQIGAETKLKQAMTKTEKWKADNQYVDTALKTLDVQWYGTKQFINAFSGIQQSNSNLISTAAKIYTSLYSPQALAAGGK